MTQKAQLFSICQNKVIVQLLVQTKKVLMIHQSMHRVSTIQIVLASPTNSKILQLVTLTMAVKNTQVILRTRMMKGSPTIKITTGMTINLLLMKVHNSMMFLVNIKSFQATKKVEISEIINSHSPSWLNKRKFKTHMVVIPRSTRRLTQSIRKHK